MIHNVNKATYEDINEAQAYSEKDGFTIDRYRQFFHHFPTNVNTVLDVGCNTGRGGKIFRKLKPNLQLIGLDCLKSRLNKIPEGIYNETICSYTRNIFAKNSFFDVVVAGEFIEHLYIKDVHQTFQEFYRVIKTGGRLLLTTPNPDYIRLKLTGESVLGGAHVSQHYPDNLKNELETIGFTNIKIIGSGKVSRMLSENFPFLTVYGSYLTLADKT